MKLPLGFSSAIVPELSVRAGVGAPSPVCGQAVVKREAPIGTFCALLAGVGALFAAMGSRLDLEGNHHKRLSMRLPRPFFHLVRYQKTFLRRALIPPGAPARSPLVGLSGL
jgi:hypothetical protein